MSQLTDRTPHDTEETCRLASLGATASHVLEEPDDFEASLSNDTAARHSKYLSTNVPTDSFRVYTKSKNINLVTRLL